uniref:Branched-chain amino acid ABC transporter permease n=1 Tax=Thermogemmatispora argillosa TaxID=2045280 RepID=A0A455T148_9CHLR|nr:branched-chain amino acid ABC transporter permease [Thermogemmatispora argillosa]
MLQLQTYLLLLLTGIMWGGVYLLMAFGLNLIYGVMKVVNLAHGDFIVVAGLLAVTLYGAFQAGPALAIPLAALLFLVVGLVVYRGLLAHVDTAGPQGELRTLLITFGLSSIISNIALLIWGGQYQSVPFFQSSVRLGPLFLPESLIVSSLVAFVLAFAVQLWLTRTRSGRLVRATAQSELGAASCGLNTGRIRLLTFALGAAMAGAAGALTVVLIPVQAASGGFVTVQAFTLIALGGLGNYLGALLAAILLGVIEVSSSYFLGASAASALIYLIFILVLIVRPQGLLGQRGRI